MRKINCQCITDSLGGAIAAYQYVCRHPWPTNVQIEMSLRDYACTMGIGSWRFSIYFENVVEQIEYNITAASMWQCLAEERAWIEYNKLTNGSTGSK